VARQRFRKWGKDWGYSTVEETLRLLSGFSPVAYGTSGVLAAFLPGEGFKRIARPVDRLLEHVLPECFHYVIFGYAVKPDAPRGAA
jgi:hypothetical protein